MSPSIALSATASTGPGIALPAQTLLEAYEVEALVAQGSFALVYRASHRDTRQVVAIKEYFPEALAIRQATRRVTPRSPSGSERFEAGRRAFLREARSLARFEHPSLVRVLGLFEANGTAYRVMSFTPGPTLLAYRRALGRMPAAEDLRLWVDGLLGALATLHGEGCTHGAVSAANILLRSGERPLLLGFQSVPNALAPGRRQAAVEMVGTGAATPEGPASSARFAEGAVADVHELAATLRYCIEGEVQASAPLAEAWRREGGQLPIPSDMMRLFRVIDACLSVEGRERPRDALEFRRRVRADAAGRARVIVATKARQDDHLALVSEANTGSVPRVRKSVVADFAAPTPVLSPVAPAPPITELQAGDSVTDVSAMPPTDGVQSPQGPDAVSITGGDAASRPQWPRGWAVKVSVAASLVLAAVATVWHYRHSEPPPPPSPPLEAHADVAPMIVDADPSPPAESGSAPVSSAPPRADAQPATAKPTAAPAPPLVAPPGQPKSPPAAKKPVTPRKTLAATTKTRSPHEACAARKGFALYKCMQLQCAKPAFSGHADCKPLR